jgi:hypothetical protein
MVDNPVYPERTDRLLDLPEARVSSGGRKDSLVPGIKNEHLMIAGIAVSGLLSLVALSQTQGVQNLLKRFTNPRAAAAQQQQETMPDNAGEPINITPSRVNQPQGFQVVSNAQQEAQARAIAAQIQAQEQQQQHHHQHAEPQPNPNMYDQIGPNTIRVDPGRARQQYRYGSPFGASISTN